MSANCRRNSITCICRNEIKSGVGSGHNLETLQMKYAHDFLVSPSLSHSGSIYLYISSVNQFLTPHPSPAFSPGKLIPMFINIDVLLSSWGLTIQYNYPICIYVLVTK